MPVGRNDPCPCGSGRKFKRCHGTAERAEMPSPAAARADALRSVDRELGDRLMRFARRHYGPYWLADALDAAELPEMDELSEAELQIVIPWLRHFAVNEAGATLAGEWRRHEGRRLSADEALLIAAYESAWVSLWEVQDVDRGVGSRLRDVLTGEERFVNDVSSSRLLNRLDTVLAIVVTCDGVSFFGGLHLQPLPPRFADIVAREARRMCRVRTRPVSIAKLRDPDLQVELLSLWSMVVDDMVRQPPPEMHNTDGDPVVPTRDDFVLTAPHAEVARRLASMPGVTEQEPHGDDTVFVVTKPGNVLHRSWDNTVIGQLVLSSERLTIETNSTRRADTLRSSIEEHLRGLARFRVRTETNTADLMAQARAPGRPRTGRADEPLPPEVADAMRQFREDHFRNWLDDTIPALNGLTPRAAAQSPRTRPKLELLLKDIEYQEAALPEGQRIDIRWLREELGLT